MSLQLCLQRWRFADRWLIGGGALGHNICKGGREAGKREVELQCSCCVIEAEANLVAGAVMVLQKWDSGICTKWALAVGCSWGAGINLGKAAFFFFFKLFIHLWLCWVFVSAWDFL